MRSSVPILLAFLLVGCVTSKSDVSVAEQPDSFCQQCGTLLIGADVVGDGGFVAIHWSAGRVYHWCGATCWHEWISVPDERGRERGGE